jgi:hypothetical protein
MGAARRRSSSSAAAAAARRPEQDVFVCKLEDVPTREGHGTLYLAYEGGALRTAHALTPADDARALAKLTRAVGKRRVMRCSPDLARAGAALGYVAAPVPQAILEDRAACAVKTSMLGAAAELENEACLELARASYDFFVAAPWQKWRGPGFVAARIDLRGGKKTLAAPCTMELTGQQHPLLAGLLLSDEGDLARALGLAMTRSRNMLLGVVLGDRPEFAALAIDDAFRLRRVPRVAFSIGESEAPHGTWQVLVLAAALRAAVSLVPAGRGERDAEGVARLGPLEAQVTLDVPVH